MVFAGNFQQRRESLAIFVDKGADLVSYMLIDQHNRNVLPLFGKAGECLLDISGRRLGIDDKEVLIAVLVDVANASKNETCR